MTSIKGWAETLQRADEVPEETRRKGLGIIMSETDRLYTMVEELLDFSRMQNGGLSLHTERLDLGAELGDVLLMMGQRAESEGIRFVFQEPETPCPVFAGQQPDAAGVRQPAGQCAEILSPAAGRSGWRSAPAEELGGG